jgi:hypothetical protein
MLESLLKRKDRWLVKTGELDHQGKPKVICKHGGIEYCFRRAVRDDRLVWLLWRRYRMFFTAPLNIVGRSEGAAVVEHARQLLEELEPSVEVQFDYD